MCTRTVWSRVEGASLPRAIRRILPSSSAANPKGGEAHPTSICPDIACVKVKAEAPVATGLAETLKCLISANSVMWVEAPLVEYATVLPLRSPKLLSGEAAGTYQYKSLAPVV